MSDELMDGKITMNRVDGSIVITIKDDCSGIEFLEIEMNAQCFLNAITGFAAQPVSLRMRGREFVGKFRKVEYREKLCPFTTMSREELRAWLEANAQEDGWVLDAYLGSKNSVERGDGGVKLRYRVVKYV